MNQPLQLKLNAEALQALFPEGSTARVELQSAVIAEFARKNIKPTALGSDIHRAIENAKHEASNELSRALKTVKNAELGAAGAKVDGYGYVTLDANIKTSIKMAAASAVQAEVQASIKERVEAAMNSYGGTIKHNAQVAINNLVDAEIRDAVKARVAAVVAGL